MSKIGSEFHQRLQSHVFSLNTKTWHFGLKNWIFSHELNFKIIPTVLLYWDSPCNSARIFFREAFKQARRFFELAALYFQAL